MTQTLRRVTEPRQPVTNRAATIDTLRRNADAIKAYGATAFFVFGSAARDEMGPTSDVDGFIDYDPSSRFSLIDQIGLQKYLADVLQREVDLTTRGGLHPRLKSRIERSSVKVLWHGRALDSNS